MTDAKSGDETEHESLDEWWSSSPVVDLSRSDWSIILETLNEQAAMDEMGDHIDQMSARERREIMERIQNQAQIEPSPELTRQEYQSDESERSDA